MSFDDYVTRYFPVDAEVSSAFDRLPDKLNEHGYDPWGFQPNIAKHLYSAIGRPLYNYFRPTVTGLQNLPPGRCLLIGNHSGQLPLDGMVVAVACLLHGEPPRMVRAMAERYFPRVPFLNEMFARGGVVVGDPINCRNLLEAGNAILVFPEGARGCGKPIQQRYQLTRFGRGFMRLALQTDTPVVPFSVIGAEESIPSVANFKPLAQMLGAPYVPIPLHLPLLGPLSYLPLPTKFYLDFGAPMTFSGLYDDEDELIDEKVAVVRDRIQAMIDEGLTRRPSIF